MNPEHETTHSPELAGRIIARINEEHITPRPRWQFVLENWVFWTIGGVAVLVGAIAVAGAFFKIVHAGWQYQVATHDTWLAFVLDAAPLVWLLLLVAFILIGYFNIRFTKRGYRYPFIVIVVGVVLSSTSVGVGLYALGLGEVFDDALGQVPFYHPVSMVQQGLWSRPDRGLIAGEVLRENEDGSFTLQEFNGPTWTVDGTDLRGPDEAVIDEGKLVRVVGVPVSATSTASTTPFHACFVFPWDLPPHGNQPPSSLPMKVFGPTQSKSNIGVARSLLCTGVRPYASLRALQ